jgi:adenosylmethionine-8-amino-7-oxononanoate aminotransferase
MLSRRILRWRLAPPFPRPCDGERVRSRQLRRTERVPFHLYHGQTCYAMSVGESRKGLRVVACWATVVVVRKKEAMSHDSTKARCGTLLWSIDALLA